MSAALVAVVGWTAATLSGAISIPQLVRTLRTRSVAGLSLLTWQTLLIAGLSWLGHGMLVGSAQIIVPNAILLGGATAVLSQLQRHRMHRWWTVWPLPVIYAATAVSLDFQVGPAAFALMMGLPAVGGQVVQLRAIRTAADVSGVSPVMLGVNAAAQLFWCAYGLLVADVAVIWVAIPLAVVMFANLAALALRRRSPLSVRSRAHRPPGRAPGTAVPDVSIHGPLDRLEDHLPTE